jgi:hypothetical protein
VRQGCLVFFFGSSGEFELRTSRSTTLATLPVLFALVNSEIRPRFTPGPA